MIERSDSVPAVTFSWEEGRYFDLWMIVHFFTGTVIGLAAYLVGINPTIAYTGTFVGLTLYEVVEEVFKVEETLENRLADIIFGSLGFALFYQFISPGWSLLGNQTALGVAAVCMIGGSILGWRAYRRRVTT